MTTFFFYYNLCDKLHLEKISSIFEIKDAYVYGNLDSINLVLTIDTVEKRPLMNKVNGKLVHFPNMSLTSIVEKLNSMRSNITLRRDSYTLSEVTVHEMIGHQSVKAFVVL